MGFKLERVEFPAGCSTGVTWAGNLKARAGGPTGTSGATDSAELRCGRLQREERGDVSKVASGRAAVGAIPGLQEGCEVVEQLGHLCFDERSADHHSGATCFGCKERVELGELG